MDATSHYFLRLLINQTACIRVFWHFLPKIQYWVTLWKKTLETPKHEWSMLNEFYLFICALKRQQKWLGKRVFLAKIFNALCRKCRLQKNTMHYGLLSSKTILDLVSFLYHTFNQKDGAAGRHTAYMGWKGMVFSAFCVVLDLSLFAVFPYMSFEVNK